MSFCRVPRSLSTMPRSGCVAAAVVDLRLLLICLGFGSALAEDPMWQRALHRAKPRGAWHPSPLLPPPPRRCPTMHAPALHTLTHTPDAALNTVPHPPPMPCLSTFSRLVRPPACGRAATAAACTVRPTSARVQRVPGRLPARRPRLRQGVPQAAARHGDARGRPGDAQV